MSNATKELELDCKVVEGCGAIERIIQPRDKDLGGFSVRRVLPTVGRKQVGPWVFFDHMGPAELPAGSGISVRPHPHVNLATVTYLFEGEMLHRDSLGSEQVIRPGDLNLMVAGRGIVHSERQRPEVTAHPQRIHGLQLWLALPEAMEECEPAFLHYPSEALPRTTVEGVALRVMMGAAYGLRSPVRTDAETLYVEADLQPGQRLRLPDAEERAVYVASGRLQARDNTLPAHAMAVFETQAGIEVEAIEASRIAIVGGERLGPRFMEWNFVSSRRERIEQAKADWKAGRFPKVPGDEAEFIPLPE